MLRKVISILIIIIIFSSICVTEVDAICNTTRRIMPVRHLKKSITQLKLTLSDGTVLFNAKKEDPEIEIPPPGINFIFAIDMSESMQGDRIDMAKENVTNIIETLYSDSNPSAPPESYEALYSGMYPDKSLVNIAIVPFNGESGDTEDIEFKNVKDEILNDLNNIQPAATNMYDLVKKVDEATNLYDPRVEQILYIISGGNTIENVDEEIYYEYERNDVIDGEAVVIVESGTATIGEATNMILQNMQRAKMLTTYKYLLSVNWEKFFEAKEEVIVLNGSVDFTSPEIQVKIPINRIFYPDAYDTTDWVFLNAEALYNGGAIPPIEEAIYEDLKRSIQTYETNYRIQQENKPIELADFFFNRNVLVLPEDQGIHLIADNEILQGAILEIEYSILITKSGYVEMNKLIDTPQGSFFFNANANLLSDPTKTNSTEGWSMNDEGAIETRIPTKPIYYLDEETNEYIPVAKRDEKIRNAMREAERNGDTDVYEEYADYEFFDYSPQFITKRLVLNTTLARDDLDDHVFGNSVKAEFKEYTVQYIWRLGMELGDWNGDVINEKPGRPVYGEEPEFEQSEEATNAQPVTLTPPTGFNIIKILLIIVAFMLLTLSVHLLIRVVDALVSKKK